MDAVVLHRFCETPLFVARGVTPMELLPPVSTWDALRIDAYLAGAMNGKVVVIGAAAA